MDKSIGAWDDTGVLPPGDHEMTLDELSCSVLVMGDGSSDSWDSTWRADLVQNLGALVGHLETVGIRDVYVDGSFCSNKDRPGDIDGYFVTDLPAWITQQQPQLQKMDVVWDLRAGRPDAHGKLKPLMWHTYRVELYPVYRPPYAQFSAQGAGSPPVTIDRFFRESRDGTQRGVVKVVPSGGAP